MSRKKLSLQQQLDGARKRVRDLEQQIAAQQAIHRKPAGTGPGGNAPSKQPAMH